MVVVAVVVLGVSMVWVEGLAIVVILVEEQGSSVKEFHQSNVPQSTAGSPDVLGAVKRIMKAAASSTVSKVVYPLGSFSEHIRFCY